MMSLDNFVETEQAKPWNPKKKHEKQEHPLSSDSHTSSPRQLQATLEPNLTQSIETIVTDLVKSLSQQAPKPPTDTVTQLEKRVLLLEQSIHEIQQENTKLHKEITSLKRIINQQNEKITTVKTYLASLEKELEAIHPEIDEKIVQAIKTMSRGLKKAFLLSQEQ